MIVKRHIGLPENEMGIIEGEDILIHNIVTPELKEKDQIITQLTNNWNELEKDINNQLMMTRKFDDYNEGYFDATLHYYNKMKEIKGNNDSIQ